MGIALRQARLYAQVRRYAAELERRVAERTTELRRQTDLYESLLRAQSDLGEGVVISENERLIYVNDALCKIYGYSAAELLALPSFLDLVAPEEQALLADHLRRRVSGESLADQGEATILHKNGYRINIEYAVKQMQTGDRAQLFAIVRDITERKRAEENLLRLSSAVRTSVDSIVLTDIEGRMIEVNGATLAMYGTHDKADLIGKSAFELIVPEDREKAFAGMGAVLEKGYVKGQEYRVVSKKVATLLWR